MPGCRPVSAMRGWSVTDHLSNPDARPPAALIPAPATRRFAGARAILALMLREMSTRYGRTPGGYIWAVLEPVAAIVVLSIIFSLMLRNPPLGNSFPLFYATGYLPFAVYLNVQMNVQNAINFSKPLLMYPAVSWIDTIIARALLSFLTTVVVLIIVLYGVIEVTDTTAILSVGPMIEAVLWATAIGFGIGVFNCLVAGLFPLYGTVWGIATRPKILLAGVLFIYEGLPEIAQNILWYLPWIHFTGMFRQGVYPTYEPEYISLIVMLCYSLIPMAFGLLLLRRYYQDILMR